MPVWPMGPGYPLLPIIDESHNGHGLLVGSLYAMTEMTEMTNSRGRLIANSTKTIAAVPRTTVELHMPAYGIAVIAYGTSP